MVNVTLYSIHGLYHIWLCLKIGGSPINIASIGGIPYSPEPRMDYTFSHTYVHIYIYMYVCINILFRMESGLANRGSQFCIYIYICICNMCLHIYIVLWHIKPSYICLKIWATNSSQFLGRYIAGMIMGYKRIFIWL